MVYVEKAFRDIDENTVEIKLLGFFTLDTLYTNSNNEIVAAAISRGQEQCLIDRTAAIILAKIYRYNNAYISNSCLTFSSYLDKTRFDRVRVSDNFFDSSEQKPKQVKFIAEKSDSVAITEFDDELRLVLECISVNIPQMKKSEMTKKLLGMTVPDFNAFMKAHGISSKELDKKHSGSFKQFGGDEIIKYYKELRTIDLLKGEKKESINTLIEDKKASKTNVSFNLDVYTVDKIIKCAKEQDRDHREIMAEIITDYVNKNIVTNYANRNLADTFRVDNLLKINECIENECVTFDKCNRLREKINIKIDYIEKELESKERQLRQKRDELLKELADIDAVLNENGGNKR